MLDIFLSHLTFWHWLILAVILLVAELTTGSGFVLWVAIGACVVALIKLALPSLTWPWQVLFFSCFSLIACLSWWRFLKLRTEKNDKPFLNQRTQQYVGKQYVLSAAITNGRGKVRIGDTHWVVEGDDAPEGAAVEVIAVDGVILKVKNA